MFVASKEEDRITEVDEFTATVHLLLFGSPKVRDNVNEGLSS